MLIVGASLGDDTLNGVSNFGQGSVHLFAPSRVRTTNVNNTFGNYSGTSSAAPHVSGVAALLLSVRPNATTQQIRQAILDGVDWVPQLDGMSIANGRLNAYGALRQLLAMPEITVSTNTPNLSFNQSGFTLGTVFITAPNASELRITDVFIRVNRRNANNNNINSTTHTVRLNASGVGNFTPGNTVNSFYENEHIEILVFRDASHQTLLSRQIVEPTMFDYNQLP